MRRFLADVVSVKLQNHGENATKTDMQMVADASVQKKCTNCFHANIQKRRGFLRTRGLKHVI